MSYTSLKAWCYPVQCGVGQTNEEDTEGHLTTVSQLCLLTVVTGSGRETVGAPPNTTGPLSVMQFLGSEVAMKRVLAQG